MSTETTDKTTAQSPRQTLLRQGRNEAVPPSVLDEVDFSICETTDELRTALAEHYSGLDPGGLVVKPGALPAETDLTDQSLPIQPPLVLYVQGSISDEQARALDALQQMTENPGGEPAYGLQIAIVE